MKNTATSPLKWFTSSSKALWILLGIALAIRLILLGTAGYTTDVQTFEAWTLTLRDWGFGGFYAHAGFADYPPGYLYVLGALAAIYKVLGPIDSHNMLLQVLVKLPAILADLIDAALVYTLVRRFAPRFALGAAAFLVLNPAILAVSAFWGQVDSVAAIGTLFAVWLIDGVQRGLFARRNATVLAWVVLAASILMKPAPIVLVPLFLVLPFTVKPASERIAKLIDALIGGVAAIAVTYLLSLPFSPDHDFIGCMHWLLERFQFASNVYPYNSVNAFNLYSIASDFWMSDSTSSPMTFGLPQVVWGACLVIICVTALTIRFALLKTPRAMLEAAMLTSLAFFAFATRMHERYIFNALIFAIPLIAISRAYLVAACALTATFGLNLVYSLVYLTAVTSPQPDTNTRDLMPFISHPCGFIVVLVLFAIGFQYLGFFNVDEALEEKMTSSTLEVQAGQTTFFGITLPARTLAPVEGMAPFTARDWILAVGFGVLSFLICLYHYWLPVQKIFDEIYYARSGAEYIKHIEQYEWTHPPLTKLVITLSMMLFGGVPAGDNSIGWRFMNIIVGAIMVGILYRFVKKITGSTFAAAIAAGLMVFDGFHFAQSRIATPEITVACLSLATLTAFYEYWISAQVRRAIVPRSVETTRLVLAYGAAGIVALVLGIALAHFATRPGEVGPIAVITKILLCFYPFLGFCLAIRWWMLHNNKLSTVMTYPDGSRVIDGVLTAPEGEIPFGMTIATTGTSLTIRAQGDVDGTALRCDADGTLTAVNPAAGWTTVLKSTAAPRGLLVTAILAGLLGASKWNGLFDLLLIWAIMIAITVSRSMNSVFSALGIIKRVEADQTVVVARADRSTWGNPFGFPLDLTLGVTAFVGMTIYVMSYIPYFSGFGHDLTDLVQLQHSMYAYHADLRATHPYQSTWWQWPLLERPISYYYEDFRLGAARNVANACCVSEILALPNPINWWAGLFSVPAVAWLAWRERRKGYALIVMAYFAQWLPWIMSPRIAFEYHFFPNLALICASNAILLQRLWKGKPGIEADKLRARRIIVAAFLVTVVAGFVFWYPIVSGFPTSYAQWQAEVLAIPDQARGIADHLGLRWI